MDPYFTSKPQKNEIPEDAYIFTKDVIPPDAFEQDKYWYSRKGVLYKIEDMSSHHLGAVMAFIKATFPCHLDSCLYNSLKAQYIKLRTQELRNPIKRYYIQKRQEVLQTDL